MSNNDYPNQPFGGQPFGGMPPGSMPPGGIPTIAQGKKSRRGKRSDAGPKRSTSSFGWLFLVFAAAVGLLAVIITASPEKKTFVVKAKDAIAPLVAVEESQFEIVGVPSEAVEPETLAGASEEEARKSLTDVLADKWFLYPVGKGQQIRSSMLVSTGTLATPLASDERLVSITVNVARAVSGSVRTGNLVDIYVSDNNGLTGVLGQGVEVVAVSLQPEQFESAAKQQFDQPDKNLSDFIPEQPVGGTYVLRVKAADVARYVAADAAGTITMSLHGSEAQRFTPAPTDLIQTICGAASTEPACVRVGQ
jgi:Flp pilus assembly protein CpaB